MMKEFALMDVKSKIEDVKNAKEIKTVEKRIDELKKLMPKKCDCGDKKSMIQDTSVYGDAAFYESNKPSLKRGDYDSLETINSFP